MTTPLNGGFAIGLPQLLASIASIQNHILSLAEGSSAKATGYDKAETVYRRLEVSKAGYLLSLHDENRSYSLHLPTSVKSLGSMQLVRTLKGPGHESTERFTGLDFLESPVPAEFEKFHALILQEVNRMLPPAVRAQLNAWTSKPTAKAKTQTENSEDSAQTDNSEASGSRSEKPLTEATTPEYQTIQLSRQDMPDLQFQGKVLARVASSPVQGRGRVLLVYQTKGGKMVGQRVGYSLWPNERQRSEVSVADTLEGLVPFFGHSYHAKALYQALNFDACELVD